MGKILGEVTIRANGKQLKTKQGATLNPGGNTFTRHTGAGRSWGASKQFTVPSIAVVIAADEDVSVIEIGKITDATLTWEGDNGMDFMMTGVAQQAPFTLSDSGDITGTFEGDEVVEV
ncbi:phage tail tube protein [Shewanella baltica]|uniref:phage tail tube protein n=1 Tax=Shewanella baltica TaxID=62322 RepID=UPI003D79ABDB